MDVLGCCEKQFFIHNPKVPEVIKVPELPVFCFLGKKIRGLFVAFSNSLTFMHLD